jgi:hypothetical protein
MFQGIYEKLKTFATGEKPPKSETAAAPAFARYIPPTLHTEDIPAEVFSAELADLRRRRAANKLEEIPEGSSPHPSQELAGLALSGGGIRSATFNLGIIQALHRSGLFRRFDYLSTVSGGGYIGSCLSSVFATTPPDSELALIVSGLPEDARFSPTATQLDNKLWRIESDLWGNIGLILTSRGEPYRCHLTTSIIRKDDPGDARPAEGLEAVVEVSQISGPGCTITKEAGRSTLTIDVPGDEKSAEIRLKLRIHADFFPFNHQLGEQETKSFAHLRDQSNYLVPKKFLATFRLPGLFVRGLIVNLAMILPFLLVTALATVWMSGGAITKAMRSEQITIEVPAPPLTDETGAAGAPPYHYYIDMEQHLANTAMVNNIDKLKANPDKCFFMTIDGLPEAIGVGPQATLRDQEWIVAGQVPEKIYLTYPVGFRRGFNIKAVVWTEDIKPAACEMARLGHLTKSLKNPVDALADNSLGLIKFAALAGLLILGIYPVGQWILGLFSATGWQARDRITRWVCGGTLLVLLLFSAIKIQPLAVYYFHTLSDTTDAVFGDAGEMSTVAAAVLTLLGSLFSGSMARRTAGIMGKLGLIVLGILGPLFLWLIYLNLTRWMLADATAPAWTILLWREAEAAGAGSWSPNLANFGTETLQFTLHYLAITISWIGDLAATVFGGLYDNWMWDDHARNVAGSYGLLSLVIFVGTRLFYDVNATSFHRFYRDRLTMAYLINPWKHTREGRILHNDGQKLSRLNSERSPYHLINTTLNIQQSNAANLRGRNGTFFLFSRNYCGSQMTGYRRTAELEEAHSDLDLGTAMAISGAAASPNMGRNTMKSLVFIMTLLNIRLGYWFPHPGNLAGKDYKNKYLRRVMHLLMAPFTRVTPYHLIMEMIGNLKETGWSINLTDGGHLENMGLYELVRRRCKLIVIGDAEADPEMVFAGLADAIRMVRIDFSIHIDLDVDKIRVDAEGHSGSHYAIGRIHYDAETHGYIVYIKSSTTGDEDIQIKEYDSLEPDFPQQTTADQFFDEAQFEAYRALGHHEAMSLLSEPEFAGRDLSRLDNIIAALEALMAKNKA